MSGVLPDLAARLLRPDEREAVLGDLSEAGEGGWRGALGILGLAIRRQALLWTNWRPWLAGFGLALPGSFLLMGHSLLVSRSVQRFAQGPVDQMWPLLSGVFLLIAWSWTGGYVVSSLSRATLLASIALTFSPCLFCLARFRGSSLPALCLLLFLIPATHGIRKGLRPARVAAPFAIVLAAAVTLLTMLRFGGGVNWALIWPAWHMAGRAVKARGSL